MARFEVEMIHMNKKSLLPFLCALTLTLSLLPACGGTPPAPSETPPPRYEYEYNWEGVATIEWYSHST